MLLPENGLTSTQSCGVFGFGVGVGVGDGVGLALLLGDGVGLALVDGLGSGVGSLDAGVEGLTLGVGLAEAVGLGDSVAFGDVGLGLALAAGLDTPFFVSTVASLAAAATWSFFSLSALAVVAGRVAHVLVALSRVARCV
jgi:hypothetical protein